MNKALTASIQFILVLVLVSFKDLPVVGHAVLYYQYQNKWYKTQFEADDDQVNKGWRNTKDVLYISRLLFGLKYYSLALFSLTFVGCTTARITNKLVGNTGAYSELIKDIHGNNIKGKYLCVYLPGSYGYIFKRVDKMNNAILPYSLIYANCAHYVEYLLLSSRDPVVASIALLRQKTPLKLYWDLIVSQYPQLNI